MVTMKHGSVVVGVDGSTGGDVALTWAVRYASARRLPLLLVYGAGEMHQGSELFGPPQTVKAVESAARQVTDHALALVGDLDPNVDVEVATPLLDPREALLECSQQASVLVVGTRGFGPVRILLLGAVSAAVATHAACPVAVVREVVGEPDPAARHVLVGTDAGPASNAALEFGFDLASTEGRALDVVHSWAERSYQIELDTDAQRLQHKEDAERMLAEAIAGYSEKFPDVTVERHLPDTSAIRSLLELSANASTLVVGSRGRTGVQDLLSSVSRDIVERALCTVVVVRP